MNSNGYLSQINLLTRITDTTMTLIDNIFTNTMNYNSFSGLILQWPLLIIFSQIPWITTVLVVTY